MSQSSEPSTDINTWKKSRRGQSFIKSLLEINAVLAQGRQEAFDPDNPIHLQRAMVAQNLNDTHYAKIRHIFDQQLEAITGYSTYDIFNLGEVGEQMLAHIGQWVMRQSYLDAAMGEGRGRLEKILSLSDSYTRNNGFLETVMSDERLEQVKDKRDTWKAAYKIFRPDRAARKELGRAAPRGLFAKFKGLKLSRKYDQWVEEAEADVKRAPVVKARIEEERTSIWAEFSQMNGLQTTVVTAFQKVFQELVDSAKRGTPLVNIPAEATVLERTQAEAAAVEEVLHALRRLRTPRIESGDPVGRYLYDLDNPAQDEQILVAQAARLIVRAFAEELRIKVASGTQTNIVNFRTDTAQYKDKLTRLLDQQQAVKALSEVLTRQLQEIEINAAHPGKPDIIKTLQQSLMLLSRIRS